MDPMDAIRQTYFQECDELLLAMEEGLLAMESGEADMEWCLPLHEVSGMGLNRGRC